LAQLLAFTLSDFSTIFANAQAACSDATENLFAPGFTAPPVQAIQAMPTHVSSGPLNQINTLLTAYDKRIVEDPAQIRYYATNRLLELTDDPDVKIRIKALELLGKVADVGLFADRTEITIKDKTTRDLEKELEAYFSKYVQEVQPVEEIEDAVISEPEEGDAFDSP
jgi:hypothetical protein